MDDTDARRAGATASSPQPDISPATERPTRRPHDEAFAVFYKSFTPTLVAFLRWQGVPLRDAADLAQETMTDAYRDWERIRHPEAWARRVASRRWARHVAESVEDSVEVVPEPVLVREVSDVTKWEQRHDVLRILDQLPSRQRQVLAWSLDGYTPTEIASELQMTPEAVRASLYKARRAVASS
jgi:RNA polymerase sigma-70 factor (ECF subfamily)